MIERRLYTTTAIIIDRFDICELDSTVVAAEEILILQTKAMSI